MELIVKFEILHTTHHQQQKPISCMQVASSLQLRTLYSLRPFWTPSRSLTKPFNLILKIQMEVLVWKKNLFWTGRSNHWTSNFFWSFFRSIITSSSGVFSFFGFLFVSRPVFRSINSGMPSARPCNCFFSRSLAPWSLTRPDKEALAIHVERTHVIFDMIHHDVVKIQHRNSSLRSFALLVFMDDFPQHFVKSCLAISGSLVRSTHPKDKTPSSKATRPGGVVYPLAPDKGLR